MEHRFQHRLQVSLDHHLGDSVGHRRDSQRSASVPRPSVSPPDAPVAGSSCPMTSDSRSGRGCCSSPLSNSSIDWPSTPAAPWFAFTRLYASHTSRLAIQNGFALSTRVLPLRVARANKAGRRRPFGPVPLQNLQPYYGRLRPCAPHRYSRSRGGCPLELLPLHRDDRFLRSSPKPGSRSRRLHAGCRLGSLQAPPNLIPGSKFIPGFDIASIPFDTSSAVHLRSSPRSAPDGVLLRLFHQRSPRRLLTHAA